MSLLRRNDRSNFWSLAVFLALAISLPVRAAEKDIEIVELGRSETQSLHRVRVFTQEIPHVHAHHDSTVVLQKGSGTLFMNGQAHAMKSGDVIMIPRGVPHYYVHQSSSSYSQALVIFSPPFDGKDRIPVTP